MMDMNGKEFNVDQQKGSDDPLERNLSSDWQVNGNYLSDISSGMIPIGRESCTRPPIDTFCLPIWEQPNNGQTLDYCDVNAQDGATSIDQTRPDMGWTSSAMLISPAFSAMIPHFPADSTFIERAARFSCFSGGNCCEMMNPFGVPDSMLPYFRLGGVSVGNFQVPEEGSPYKNGESSLRAKQGAGVSGNESDEATGVQVKQNCTADESPRNRLGYKKRKRGQDTEHDNKNNDGQLPSDDKAKDAMDIKQKGDQKSTSISKHGKQESDQPKEEYIHVRARRGQATNSHSLAERVRREKISERMKFLQDLVPGCSKVTGKAVMLDEIINYVQSLQRQVEFLSMKLATVTPRLDANIEALLTKDIARTRAGLSYSLASTPDTFMPFSPLHLSQPGVLPSNSSETLRRQPTNNQSAGVCGEYKEPTSQVWEDELNNIVDMGFSSNVLHNNQDKVVP